MKLAYREYGEGRALIILHGLFGQSDNWNTLAKKFAGEGYRVFTPDLRNHGLSPHSTEFSYELMAEDIAEFIRQHQLKDPVLIGHSLGAKTVMFFERMFPGICTKYVLVDMAARAYEAKHSGIISTLESVDFRKVKSRKEVEAILVENISDYGTRQFLLKNVYHPESGEGLAWRFNLESINRNYHLVNVAVPAFYSEADTLIVRGEKSDYVGDKDLEDFGKRYSSLSVATIAGSGHWVHAEKPVEFLDAVLSFIKA